MSDEIVIKKTTIRLPEDVLTNAKICAKAENLSLNEYITSSIISSIFKSNEERKKEDFEVKKIKNKDKNPLDAYIRR